MDIKLCCRACMITLPKNWTSLFNIESMRDLFTNCSNLQLNENNFLPKYLCEDCYKTCIEWKSFVKKCEKSQNKFVELLTFHQNTQNHIKTEIKTEDESVPIEEDPLKINSDEENYIEMKSEETDDFPKPNEMLVKKKRSIEMKSEETDDFPKPIEILVKKKGSTPSPNEPLKEIFKCKTCSAMFVNLNAYENHYKTVHRLKDSKTTTASIKKIKKIFKCEECQDIFENLELYETHYNNVHTVFCVVCKTIKFKNFEDCLEHQKKFHTVEVLPVLFKCTFCDLGFNTILHHRVHMTKVHNLGEEEDPIFKCNICSKVLSTRCCLKNHLKTHEETTKNCCEYCGKSFKSEKYMDQHILLTHKVLQANLKCHLCPHKFKTQKRLDRHVKLHLADKEIQCEFCSLKFKTQSTYKNHRMTHTGEKKYYCSICNHGFIQHQALKIHMKTH